VHALASHLILRLTGGCAHGVDRTLQAFGCGAAASAYCAVPVCGWFLGWIGWMASTTVMLRQAQGVRTWRAAVAAFLPPAFLAVALLGGALAAEYYENWRWSYDATGDQWNQPTFWIGDAVMAYGGKGPEHGLELLIAHDFCSYGVVNQQSFCEPGTRTTQTSIPVLDGTLRDFLAMTRSERTKTVGAILAAMSERVVAHRVGDYIFTHHGFDAAAADEALWLVVMLPDPEVNGVPPPSRQIKIATAGWSERLLRLRVSELAEALEKQNAHRATLGLPPLPELLTITHGKPAAVPVEAE
jgi:hypothetical protein